MAKEGYIPRPTTLRGRIDWEVTNFSIYIASPHFEKGLTDREVRAYRATVEDISAGRHLKISDEIDDIIDHEISFWGAENLEQLENRPFIIVANHWENGPLNGNWHPQATSFVVQEVLGREITWVQGAGKETFHPVIERLGFHNVVSNAFVERVHRRIAEVNESIYANGKNDPEVAMKAHIALRKGGIVGYCPEGQISESLIQANGQVGMFLHREAQRGIPIIAVASFQMGEELIVAITEVIEPEVILRSFEKGFTAENRGQAVIDFVFGGYLAQEMPEHLRGYYKDYRPPSEVLTPSAQVSQ